MATSEPVDWPRFEARRGETQIAGDHEYWDVWCICDLEPPETEVALDLTESAAKQMALGLNLAQASLALAEAYIARTDNHGYGLKDFSPLEQQRGIESLRKTAEQTEALLAASAAFRAAAREALEPKGAKS